jgi:AcrR family transcriptional regulator
MPKIVDKEAKKLEILHAAMRVFAQHGVVKAKMIDIANAAGVGKGTIYEYFRSKEEIFEQAFQFVFDSTEIKIQEALNTTEDPERQLQLLVDVSLSHFFHDGGEFAGIMMDFWAEGIRRKDDKLLSIVDLKQIYKSYRTIIAGILENGINKGIFRKIDTFRASAVFIAAMDGIMLQWILDRELIDLNKLAKDLIAVFLDGLKKH